MLDLAADLEAAVRGEVDDFRGLQRFGELGGEQVGIHAQRPAVAVETDRVDHRHDAGVDELLDELAVDAIDAAGKLVIHAAQNPNRHSSDGIGQRSLQAVGGQPFDYEVRDARGCADREVKGGGVGHAGAVGVGDRDVAELGELLDLLADAVDHHDLDAERAQDGDVGDQVGEVVVGDDAAIERDDEDLALETRDVLEDAPQVGWFDVRAIAHR